MKIAIIKLLGKMKLNQYLGKKYFTIKSSIPFTATIYNSAAMLPILKSNWLNYSGLVCSTPKRI